MTPDIPRIGLGTSKLAGGLDAILSAVEVGYRHIDTAQNYGTEEIVGQAVRQCGLPRSELFITTKVADHRLEHDDFLRSVGESLERLQLDVIDLLLVHWPSEKDRVPLESYMTALAEAQQRGWTRLMGVSNFTISHLDRSYELLGQGSLATNQVEIHPFLQVPRMRDYARSRGLLLTAYQPLAKGTVTEDPTIRRIAGQRGIDPSTVALAFLLAEGHAVIPSSSSREHQRDNLAAGELVLTDAEMADLRALDRGGRRINPQKSPRWDD